MDSYQLQSLDFVAPQVYNASSVVNAEVGLIVYDASDSSFKGYNNSGNWTTLANSSGSPVTSSQSERVERARIVQTSGGATSACTSSCTAYRQSGGFDTSSMVHSASGVYSIGILGGKFTEAPSCTCSAKTGAGTTRVCIAMATSATSVDVVTSYPSTTTGAFSGEDTYFDIICQGRSS